MHRSHGIIDHPSESSRKTDFLFGVSLKCLVRDGQGRVLVAKETGRDWWDLPGGGMDHGEDIKTAIAREMKEEVNLEGDFTIKFLAAEDPAYLDKHNFWQLRLIFEVIPQNMIFSPGEDSHEVAFIDPSSFRQSSKNAEKRAYEYSQLLE